MSKSKSRRRSGQWKIRSRALRGAVKLATSPFGKVVLALGLIAALGFGLFLNHYWWEYAKVVDSRLVGGPFNRTSKVLAAPGAVFLEEELTRDDILLRLRDAGYSESRHNQVGHYIAKEDAVEIYPGALSYFAQEPAVLYFEDGRISRIVSLNDNTPQTAYELEPELVTHLFDDERSKRRIFKFEDFPPILVHAVLAIEDHRFFDHWGVDVIRTTKAALDGLMAQKRPRGTSTLTQQLAKNFFLTPEQTYQRKLAEALIAFQLELRLSKEQIFEYYANQVSMGRSGSFNVMGMGEAARAFYDKDVRDVTLAEAALLAGLPQGPSWLNPYRHPERAINRRNQVLSAMLQHGYIDEARYGAAVQEQLTLARGHIESSQAPYYVDLVNQHLRKNFGSKELITQDYWVYTTLDRDLQEAAVEAVRVGMEEVRERLSKQRRFRNLEPDEIPQAQAALVALDAKTGEVKAVVGGLDYGESQLNRALARRQPGSVFKPFVYAAAMDTALDIERQALLEEAGYFDGSEKEYDPLAEPVLDDHGWSVYPVEETLTAASLVDDVPTTFWYDDKPYEPANHLNKIYGLITFRYALKRSINVAAVKVAQMVGYDRVAEMAIRAGLGDDLQPTPSLALGAYEATPLQVAGAYTSLVNGGVKKTPYFVRLVRDSTGKTLYRHEPEEVEVMDPRVAHVVTDMLQDVMDHGTGIGARVRYNFTEPAAGKTGTDDDGWFAGFTTNLLCVVWVGFDDNTDLGLEGAHSALPIWAEFMRRAHEQRAFSNPEEFEAPEGVIRVEIDPDTQQLATYACPNRTSEVFVTGSQPGGFCTLHGGGGRITLATGVSGWDTGPADRQADEDEPSLARNRPRGDGPRIVSLPPGSAPPKVEEPKKKSGFFGRVIGLFKD